MLFHRHFSAAVEIETSSDAICEYFHNHLDLPSVIFAQSLQLSVQLRFLTTTTDKPVNDESRCGLQFVIFQLDANH